MSDSNYRTLVAWQRAMALVPHVYKFTRSFPDEERYVLTQQMRKAAHSVHSCIAEGRGRATRRDFKHFCVEARASLFEIDSDTEAARVLHYVDQPSVDALRSKIRDALKPLQGPIRKLENPQPTAHEPQT